MDEQRQYLDAKHDDGGQDCGVVEVARNQEDQKNSSGNQGSGGRYPGFLIEWIFYWIESSQIKILNQFLS